MSERTLGSSENNSCVRQAHDTTSLTMQSIAVPVACIVCSEVDSIARVVSSSLLNLHNPSPGGSTLAAQRAELGMPPRSTASKGSKSRKTSADGEKGGQKRAPQASPPCASQSRKKVKIEVDGKARTCTLCQKTSEEPLCNTECDPAPAKVSPATWLCVA